MIQSHSQRICQNPDPCGIWSTDPMLGYYYSVRRIFMIHELGIKVAKDKKVIF
jgi:hypothetical protein